MDLSIVIPVFNEEPNVEELLAKVDASLDAIGCSSELIIVDDGSRDGTYRVLRGLTEKHPRLRIVRLRRNFGQHAATYAGFMQADGEVIVTLDGDLQNDPADIPLLLDEMAKGYDVVCGWRKDRKDSFVTRRLPSTIVNRLISSTAPTPVHDYGCFLRAYRNWAARELAHYGSSHGWFPVLFSRLGFNVSEVAVSHNARPGGEASRHSFFKRLDQFMSVFMGVAYRPFQFVEVLGICSMAIGFVAAIVFTVLAALGSGTAYWYLTGASFIIVLWGFSIIIPALVGEYLIRMNYEIGKQPNYLIRDIYPRRQAED